MGYSNDVDIDDHCLMPEEFEKEIKIQNNSTSYDENNKTNIKIRKFDSGATRDISEGKLEYKGFYSPIVMKRFAEYMNLHRKQSDGSLRTSDNWQNLFGDKHEDVCCDSLLRHVIDVWLINQGFPEESREDLESGLCAILFNAQAWLFKILKEKYNGTKS